jgi:hypothetical protein
MRSIPILGIFLLVVNVTLCYSQIKTYTLSGFINDAITGERMANASVYDAYSGRGTLANSFGYFNVILERDTVLFRISYVGYETYEEKFLLNSNLERNIELNASLEIEAVIVKSNKYTYKYSGYNRLSITDILKIPLALGEADVLRALQNIPGITPGGEGSIGLNIRGGEDDQNLIQLDGVTVYNPGHLYGFFSIFNADALKDVQIFTGYIPPKYSNRLSGVLDIRMKEGNMKKLSGNVSVGLLSSNFTLEGPIRKDKTSFLITGRRSYIDLLLKPLKNRMGDFYAAGYYFYDFNAKMNHIFSQKSRLYLSFYHGKDQGDNASEKIYNFPEFFSKSTDKDFLNWGNTIANLRWNYLIKKNLFANFSLSYGDYKYKSVSQISQGVYSVEAGNSTLISSSENKFETASGLKDFSLKTDFNYFISPSYQMNFGANYSYLICEPVSNYRSYNYDNLINRSTSNFDTLLYYPKTLSVFVENQLTLSDKLKLNIGLTCENYFNTKNFLSFQPRLSLEYTISENIRFQSSYREMTQNIHKLSFSNRQLGSDLIVPATNQAIPEKSKQSSIGMQFEIDKDWELTVDGYYKFMTNLIEYSDGASYAGGDGNWEEKTESGKGRAYGWEFGLRKKGGKLTGSLAYTISKSERQFTKVNNGQIFPASYDRPHVFNVFSTYQLSKKITLGAVWVFMSGNLVSVPDGFFSSEFSYKELDYNTDSGFGEYLLSISRNNYRLKPYHRLDISITYSIKNGTIGQSLSMGLYNAYNRKNAYKVNYEKRYIHVNDEFANRTIIVSKLIDSYLFPILPFITYKLSF